MQWSVLGSDQHSHAGRRLPTPDLHNTIAEHDYLVNMNRDQEATSARDAMICVIHILIIFIPYSIIEASVHQCGLAIIISIADFL